MTGAGAALYRRIMDHVRRWEGTSQTAYLPSITAHSIGGAGGGRLEYLASEYLDVAPSSAAPRRTQSYSAGGIAWR